MKSFRKFSLLMWKHFLLRKHRWFMTLIEILLPILVVSGLTRIDSEIFGGHAVHHNDTIEPSFDANELCVNVFHYSLVYTPPTNFTNKIMNNVNSTKPNNRFKQIKSMNNESELEHFLSTNNVTFEDWLGVVFLNISDSNTPLEKFGYKIRDSLINYDIENLFLSTTKEGPTKDDKYRHNGFACLQLQLDSAFIKYKTEKNPYNQVEIQPFPYPEYSETNQIKSAVNSIIYIIVIVTLLILSVVLITTIIEEKESGVKELLKLVAVDEWLIWVSWFVNAFIVSCISFTVVTYLLQAIIPNIAPSVLWTCLILYCIANIPFCFMFTAIFHNTAIASSIFILAMLAIWYLAAYQKNSIYLIRFSCLFPVGAFVHAFARITDFELHDIPLSWSSLFTLEANVNGVSVGFAFMMLIFDTIFYSLITYYITAINPGKFGVRKSPFFIFESLISKIKDDKGQELINFEDTKDEKFFEKPPKTLEVSIRMENLHKNFGSVFAVRGVNLNVYKGEITALLGHNGAGKTTTMAILTGMTKPTAGSITYEKNLDVFKGMDIFRQDLGLCPQEDRLIPYITVMQHLVFFGMLKGLSKTEATYEAIKYLNLMEIADKAGNLSSTLSGGMKRKLCLSIALMGNVKTLILDEPTSGMDVESRRKIWDLLLELRGNRTIILTTHHMEEADVLGDRIAIMNHGTIVCHGTPMFLKKAYGTGYQLTVTMTQNNAEEINNLILKNMSTAELENESTKKLVYKLPLTETAKFPAFFQHLESQQQSLDIENIGVSCTTMEQVFLKVGGMSVYDSAGTSRKNSTVTDGNLLSQYSEMKKVGLSLVFQQLLALLMKKWLYTSRNFFNLLTRVALPTFICTLLLYHVRSLNSDSSLQLSIDTYPNSKVMIKNETRQSSFFKNYVNYVENHGDDVRYTEKPTIIEGLLDYGRNHLASFRRELLLAAEFNENGGKILYNRFAIHSFPMAINVYSNVFLQSEMNYSFSITAINHPVRKIQENGCNSSDPGYDIILQIMLFFALAFYTVDLSFYFSKFLSVERIDGFKHIQLMSNLSPLVYWLGTFLFDFTFFFVVMLLRIICFKTFDDYYGFLTLDSHFSVLLLIISVYIVGGLLFIYVTNYLSSSKEGSYTLLFILNIVSSFAVWILFLLQIVIRGPGGSKIDSFYLKLFVFLLTYITHLIPSFTYSLIVLKFTYIWKHNNQCTGCPASVHCSVQPLSYLEFPSETNPYGILEDLNYLIFGIVLYGGLLALIQIGVFEKLRNYIAIIRSRSYGATEYSSDIDTDVKLEQDRVDAIVGNNLSGSRDVVLLVHGLKKNFFKWFSPFTAVDNVTFAVKPSECFGLLGVNGAGKSTTFKMLTADLLPTRGDASIMNFKLSQHKTQYLSKAGYCAQTNCFIEQLSGREMLTLIASLRGIRREHIKHVVDKWISILGLEEYQNQRCGGYSGGNKRKLCTALSLIGDPTVVFLDEPTTGVDPVSRRKLYDVMDQSKASGQSVVLTSHSMEECENLCDRLTIMVRGKMKCIGTAQHLKQRYAQGFSILVKIDDTKDKDSPLNLVKNEIMQKFGPEFCVLKDEHKGLLYYQVKDTDLLWSQLFGIMEKIRNSYQIVEDYTITDTSLEEVFISFAKQA